MNNNLTQKEKMILQDQKSHEEICIAKYQNYAAQADDPELTQLFESYAQQEKQHLNTINKHLGEQGQGQSQSQNSNLAGLAENAQDAELCQDMLMTEKYVSGTYDTAVFEASDPNIRQDLSHIQKEEQQHGEGIYSYMNSKGLYNPG